MKLLSIAGYLFFLCSCCGWGYVLTRWITRGEKYQFAFMSVLGIAGLVFWGGVLNLARLAFPLALEMLLLAGFAFFVVWCGATIRSWRLARHAANSAGTITALGKIMEFLPLIFLLSAIGFYAFALLPADAFNVSDDYYTYIPRPLRMLQTGTLAGNPYELMGLDSLGANAFLQGFVLLGFPIEYLLSFDAVFSYALAGLLLIAIGKKFDLHWIYPAAAVLVFAIINPQSVNISAIYISVVMILGLFFASYLLLEQMGKTDGGGIPRIIIGILGLLFASLIALKVTLVIYAVAYFVAFFTGLFLIAHDRRRILKICAGTLLTTLGALLPWLMLNSANYASAIQTALHAPAIPSGNMFSMFDGNMVALFSTAELFWGDSFLSYGLVVLELALAGAYCLTKVFGRGEPSQRKYFLVAAAACVAAVVNYFSNGIIFAPENAVRYSSPVLIASLPFALLAVSLTVQSRQEAAKSLSLSVTHMAVVLVMSAVIIAQYWNHFMVRVGKTHYQHQTLSFAPNDDYLLYNRLALSTESRLAMRAIQYKTQPGEKILAWVSMPFHLDFARNDIYSIMLPGLLNPWLNMPLNGSASDMAHYLKGQGVRYIMWEYSGYGMPTEEKFREMLSYPYLVYRNIGQRGLYMRKMFEAMMAGGNFLYYSNGIVLFDLQQIN